jgi:hypothetical protein
MAFKIKAPETFTASINIPLLGGGKDALSVTYRHKPRSAMKTFVEGLAEREDVDVLAEVIAGWDGADAEFSAAALAELIEQQPGAVAALINGYVRAYGEARSGN